MRLALLRFALTVSRRNNALMGVKNSRTLVGHQKTARGQAELFVKVPSCQYRSLAVKQHPECFEPTVCDETDTQDHAGRTPDVGCSEQDKTLFSASQLSEIPPNVSASHLRDPSNPISNFLAQDHYLSDGRLDPAKWNFKSDTVSPEGAVSSSVDGPFKRDFGLGTELLEYHRKRYGNAGVMHVWKEFTRKVDDMDLPVEGEDADYIWNTFVTTGLEHEWMLKEVQLYAEGLWNRKGLRWRSFYKKIVGGFFERGYTKKSVEWHLRLKQIHLAWPNEVASVFQQATTAKSGLQGFRQICQNVEGHKIYNIVMPLLWEQGMVQKALALHDFLMSRGDGPRTFRDIEPLLRYVEKYGSEKQHSYLVQQLVKAGIMNASHEENLQSGHKESTTDGRLSPSAKTPFSDGFGARLFATRALTFDLILAGLKMFGVDSIGPLTLREMALRAVSVEALVSQLVALRREGISTGDSVFSRLVVKLAFGKSTRLLQDVLESDQHPDVFEDMRVQESLLAAYTMAEDWRQVNKTLAIMSVASSEDPQNHNVLFRNAVRLRNWGAAMQQFETMRQQGGQLTRATIRWLQQEVLPRRRRSRHPSNDNASVEALRRLIWIYQQVIVSGGRISPEAWTECLKRLGMYGLWDELEKLCLWLVTVYGDSGRAGHGWIRPVKAQGQLTVDDPVAFERLLPAAHSQAPLRRIFGVRLQEAIVSWGFILRPHNQLVPDSYNEGQLLIPWVRGVSLLRQLKEKGVIVQTNTIKRACRARLAIIFSEYRLSSRLRNRMLRRENPWSLQEILANIHKAWGQSVFSEYGSDYYRLVNPKTRPVRPGIYTKSTCEGTDCLRERKVPPDDGENK